MAMPGPAHYRELRVPLWRWGGNPSTRYNWVRGNCWNAARDWEFRNGNYGSTSEEARRPSGCADLGIAAGREFHADALLTIPTIGWVARDDNNATRSLGVPAQSGDPVRPGSDAIAGYDPAENRRRVSVRSLARKPGPFVEKPDPASETIYQDEWVHHLVRKFGTAAAGGVRFYAMDNEPDLWDATHTDMHPVRPGYDEILNRFLEYATAVKEVDPTAQVTGPVSWGWTGYFFSPRDRGSDNFQTHADRRAHGDVPFLPWFLNQVAAHDAKEHRRSLDYLDVHFYPQADGVYRQAPGAGEDGRVEALRLRSTRALWDPQYEDESWIHTPVALIPRMRQWIDRCYPGTKLALTEWNWGADDTLNGGLAVAEALGVFGRERLDMACYWTAPGAGSPAFFAYRMYRNADGAGNGFGDATAPVTCTDPDDVSCFGSVESATRRPIAMLLNLSQSRPAELTLTVRSSRRLTGASVYRFDGGDLKNIAHLPDTPIIAGKVHVGLPACSMTLIRCR
jgi:hypothetical protein